MNGIVLSSRMEIRYILGGRGGESTKSAGRRRTAPSLIPGSLKSGKKEGLRSKEKGVH